MKCLLLILSLSSCLIYAENSCTEDDRKSHIYPSNRIFASTLSHCGRKALGRAKGTTKCLLKKFPDLSEGCAECFGEMVKCSKDNCRRECMGKEKDEDCLNCLHENCVPDLVSCSGVEADQLPVARRNLKGS